MYKILDEVKERIIDVHMMYTVRNFYTVFGSFVFDDRF